jgi:glutamyl-tRNA synthetase
MRGFFVMITRIAPTPSGYIHIGNVLNFILTYVIAKCIGAKIELRIDDIDQSRSKKEYIDDIFDTLKKLEIEWDFGAKNRDEFLEKYTFSKKQKAIFTKLTAIIKANPNIFYVCKCSRDKPCNGSCDTLKLELKKNRTALKMRIKKGTLIKLGSKSVDLGKTMGDVTLWQKEGFASYQLASLFSDEECGINLIVRGVDLFNSSALQLYMAKVFGFESFLKMIFIHHPLIFDEKGSKLSKSQSSPSAVFSGALFQKTAQIIGVKEYHKINNMSKLLSCDIKEYIKNQKIGFEQC